MLSRAEQITSAKGEWQSVNLTAVKEVYLRSRTTAFGLSDGSWEPHERALVEHFIRSLAKRYQFDLTEQEFLFRRIGIGLSKSIKLLVTSQDVYPYFIKIAETEAINKEVSNFNRASARIPPLHVPPVEIVISSENTKYKSIETDGYALVAFRYISGSAKGHAPVSLAARLPELGIYKTIEVIDELFQDVLRDLHAFAKPEMLLFEPLMHDDEVKEVFFSQRNGVLSSMVQRYNRLAQACRNSSITMSLPHGHVHGDLHCENIILSGKHTPILIDFEMVRPKGCLLNDFAEFEIAMLMALVDGDVEKAYASIEKCYRGWNVFSFFGVDQISRSIRAVRSNLGHGLFNLCGLSDDERSMRSVSEVYMTLIMRYICSYSWVALRSLPKQKSLVIVAVLSMVFDQVYDEFAKGTGLELEQNSSILPTK